MSADHLQIFSEDVKLMYEKVCWKLSPLRPINGGISSVGIFFNVHGGTAIIAVSLSSDRASQPTCGLQFYKTQPGAHSSGNGLEQREESEGGSKSDRLALFNRSPYCDVCDIRKAE